MVHFGEFLKTWSLRSNSVTRHVGFNRTNIGGKCQNSKIQVRHFGWFSNTVCSEEFNITNCWSKDNGDPSAEYIAGISDNDVLEVVGTFRIGCKWSNLHPGAGFGSMVRRLRRANHWNPFDFGAEVRCQGRKRRLERVRWTDIQQHCWRLKYEISPKRIPAWKFVGQSIGQRRSRRRVRRRRSSRGKRSRMGPYETQPFWIIQDYLDDILRIFDPGSLFWQPKLIMTDRNDSI